MSDWVLLCTSCGCRFDVACDDIALLRHTLADTLGFELHEYHVTTEGLCPGCRLRPLSSREPVVA